MIDLERNLAEITAKLLAARGLTDPADTADITPLAIEQLARAYLDLRSSVRTLLDLVDPLDPSDPIRAALTKVSITPEAFKLNAPSKLRTVPSPTKLSELSEQQLIALYCHAMREHALEFFKHVAYIVRVWDGMDSRWTDCTNPVGREEALRVWAKLTEGGARCISYAEIDYYRIFPGEMPDGAAKEQH